jgi:hypothetical protein
VAPKLRSRAAQSDLHDLPAGTASLSPRTPSTQTSDRASTAFGGVPDSPPFISFTPPGSPSLPPPPPVQSKKKRHRRSLDNMGTDDKDDDIYLDNSARSPPRCKLEKISVEDFNMIVEYCLRYLDHEEITDDLKRKRVFCRVFSHTNSRAWVSANWSTLCKKDWTEEDSSFISQNRDHFCGRDWPEKVFKLLQDDKQLFPHPSKPEMFSTFYYCFISNNNLLIDTEFHRDDATVRSMLQERMFPLFLLHLAEKGVARSTKLEDWVEAALKYDIAFHENKIAELKHWQSQFRTNAPSRPANSRTTSTPSSSTGPLASSSSFNSADATSRKMTEEEKSEVYTRPRRACRKCRVFYVPDGHESANCPDGFMQVPPDVRYRPLTAKDATMADEIYKKSGKPVPAITILRYTQERAAKKAVAAVQPAKPVLDASLYLDNSPPAPVAKPVAAVWGARPVGHFASGVDVYDRYGSQTRHTSLPPAAYRPVAAISSHPDHRKYSHRSSRDYRSRSRSPARYFSRSPSPSRYYSRSPSPRPQASSKGERAYRGQERDSESDEGSVDIVMSHDDNRGATAPPDHAEPSRSKKPRTSGERRAASADPPGSPRAAKQVKRAEQLVSLHSPASSSVPSADRISASDYPSSYTSPPLSVSHLNWDAAVTGPNVDTFVIRRCLIDDGSHLNLIRSDLVKELGLPVYKLEKPQIVAGFDSDCGTPRTSILSDYVRLKFADPSGKWTSRTTVCIIADSLCSPVLLGLPFTSHNSLIVIPERRAVLLTMERPKVEG